MSNRQFVYFLRPVGEAGPVKIGCSDYPEGRLKSYLSWSPVQLEIIATTPGDLTLEARLHTLFADTHRHGEWFEASALMTETLAAIQAGTFNPDTLPSPRRLRPHVRSPEAAAAGGMMRRLSVMRLKGVPIPEHVLAARHTYRCTEEEKLRRWAIVRDFIQSRKAA